VASDGVTEAFSREDARFGTERAINTVAAHVRETPDEIVRALLRAVADFSAGQPRVDDVTAVILKVDDPPRSTNAADHARITRDQHAARIGGTDLNMTEQLAQREPKDCLRDFAER
jgi:hypothetical protein